MNIYFAVYVGLSLLGLGMALADNGKPKTGTTNFWTSLAVSTLIIALVYMAIKQGF